MKAAGTKPMVRHTNWRPWITGVITGGIMMAFWFGLVERALFRPSVASTLLGVATAALAGLAVVLWLVMHRSTANQAGSLISDESTMSAPKAVVLGFDDPSDPGDAGHMG